MNTTPPEPPAQTIINLSESADGHLNLTLELSHYRQEKVAEVLHDLAQRFSSVPTDREVAPDGGAPIAIIYPPKCQRRAQYHCSTAQSRPSCR